ncbi:T9SS type A sorting domain-containing protein [Saccharicrinis sp. FJH62]|uniref:T9SS type A sorting domain-containing protein n=1 Tax=Saccharicrinis sp. FJH62 TaxID=3344657 RepID=UPI0035D430CA
MKRFRLFFVLAMVFAFQEALPNGLNCTTTVGYWKNHTGDHEWAVLGKSDDPADGTNRPFYLSGASWLEVLNTSPRGNAYYILAHQYIAATLNRFRGAITNEEVYNAWHATADIIWQVTPDDVKNDRELRAQFIDLAEILDNYNNGLVDGIPHCDDFLQEKSQAMEADVMESTVSIQNSPNPFKSSTTFSFNLPEAGEVTLTVLSLSGQEIEVVTKGFYFAGENQINWQSPQNLSPGFYLYRLQAGKDVVINKMLINK